MTWIPLTKSCQVTLKDGTPCRGWWAMWNQPDRCPQCNTSTAASSRRGATQWDQFCWQVPLGAVGARIPFTLGANDGRQYKLMPGVRGIAEFVRGSVQLRSDSPPLDRRSLDELAGQAGTGREFNRWFGKDKSDSDVRGFAYLVLDGQFGLRIQVAQALTSDPYEVEAIVDIDVAAAHDLQRFIARFLARLGQAGNESTVQSRWPADSEVAAELTLADLERTVSEACREILVGSLRRQFGQALLDAPGTVMDAAAEQQVRAVLESMGLQYAGRRSALVRIPVLERERAGEAGRKAAAVDRSTREAGIAEAVAETEIRGREIRAEAAAEGSARIAAEESQAAFAQRALELAIRTRLDRNQTIVGAREAAEEVNERLRRLQQVIRERLQADRLQTLTSERAFQDVVRKAEHEASLEGLMRADEIEALRRKLDSGASLDQAAIDLKMRALTRGAELDEKSHELAVRRLEDEYARKAEESQIELERMRATSASETAIAHTRREMELSHQNIKFLAEVREIRRRAKHDRAIEVERMAQEFALRKLELLAGKDPAIVAILAEGVNPEVAKAVFGAQTAGEVDRRVRELEAQLQQRIKESVDAKSGEVERVNALASQMVDALGAVARQQATHPRASVKIDTGSRDGRPRTPGT